uniref:type II toxin-antitoxin system VapC family toxin n=1 Tax=Caenimonas sp. SL110 TaxID=1450524 RepID=UPI000A99F3A2
MSGVVTATRYVLDTSALLTLHNEERGSDRVAAILVAAAQGTAEVYGCFITLMEVFYRVWKNENQRAGRAAYVQCQQLPITWVHESPALLERAAGIKAVHALSLADAWIAATAIECEATEPPRYLRRLHSLRGL